MSATSTEPPPGGTHVTVEFDEGIAWVVLNRPEKRNAMSPALNREMLEVLEALELDERCGRKKGLKQFLDDKTIRPGLEGYKRGE